MGTIARLARFGFVMAAAPLLIASGAFAQSPRNRNKPAPTTAPAFPAKAMLAERVGELEAELASYMQRRAEATPDTVGRLELLIDLRIVARALLQSAADAHAEGDVQVCAAIRANNVMSVAAEAAALFKTATAKPGPAQAEAMNQLHALTYKLGDLKTVAQSDELCRQIGVLMAIAAGPLPAGTRELPLMRPRTAAAAPTSGPAASRPANAAGPTMADQAARINALAITQQLRRQLMSLAAAALAASNNPQAGAEAALLANALGRAVDLADGLQKSTGLDPDARVKMEAQLTDGLTLYTDPRTRAAGQARVNALDDYRKTLDRVRKLNLTPELQKTLSPAFIFAQRAGESGPKVLEHIEGYLQLCDRFDRRTAAGALPPREAKLAEGLGKQFAAARQAFLTDAANLGTGGLASTGPESLRLDVESMRTAVESLESIERLPKAVQTLLAYKPKPFGGMEKRVTAAVAALSDPKSTARDEAADYLAMIVRLANYAEQVGTAEGGGNDVARDISADVVKNYTGGTLAAFQARRRQIVIELANEASGLREVDTSKMAKLDEAQDLLATLREAGALEAALARAEPMNRWVDWGTDAAQLRALLATYQRRVVTEFQDFAGQPPTAGAAAAPAASLRRDQFAPLIKLILRDAAQGPACTALPTGIVGEIGKLVTPFDAQPFAAERYAQFALGLWTRLEAVPEPKAVAMVADALSERLRKEK